MCTEIFYSTSSCATKTKERGTRRVDTSLMMIRQSHNKSSFHASVFPLKINETFTSTIQVTEETLRSHFSSTDTLIYIGNKPGRAAAGWAGSGYRAGGLSEWKSCHTLIMQQLAQSACNQEIRTRRGFGLQSFTGSFSHAFNSFSTSGVSD